MELEIADAERQENSRLAAALMPGQRRAPVERWRLRSRIREQARARHRTLPHPGSAAAAGPAGGEFFPLCGALLAAPPRPSPQLGSPSNRLFSVWRKL